MIAPPRQRILRAASELFAANGTGKTGVDALIERADVAKATFYRYFPSKEQLIVAWMHDDPTRWYEAAIATAELRATGPGDLIPALFEVVAEWLESDDFRGCPYLNVSLEISNASSPPARACREHLVAIGAWLERAVRAAGHADAPMLAREIHTLLAGSIVLGVANRSTRFAVAARGAVIRLLDQDGSRPPGG